VYSSLKNKGLNAPFLLRFWWVVILSLVNELCFGNAEVPGSNPGDSSTTSPVKWGFFIF
jgi:hypothetical protein